MLSGDAFVARTVGAKVNIRMRIIGDIADTPDGDHFCNRNCYLFVVNFQGNRFLISNDYFASGPVRGLSGFISISQFPCRSTSCQDRSAPRAGKLTRTIN
jgi:hypothetical protein